MKKILLLLSTVLILSNCTRVQENTEKQPTSRIDTTETSFSVIVLPDTQNEVQNYPEVFIKQMDWIVKNQLKLNIRAVVHV